MSIRVSYDDLQRTSTQLDSGRQEILGQLQKLKGLVDSLVASGFVTDQASGKFQQSYMQWNTGASNVLQGLEGMSGFLKTAIQQHQQLDAQLGQSAAAG
jgi:WXG100 family type VII secretion target